MCHRIVALSLEEVEEALARRAQGEPATVSHGERQPGAPVQQAAADAYPGSAVPVIVPQDDGRLRAELLRWGFFSPRPRGAAGGGGGTPVGANAASAQKVIFNTRLETAAQQLRSQRGMWSSAIVRGRCLIPVRAFFENTKGGRVRGSNGGGSNGGGSDGGVLRDGTAAPVPRTYRFALAGSSIFLLAGIAENGRFSIVTTAPNGQVAPIHDRMPLVLGRGESGRWLAGDFAGLADRTNVELTVTEE